MKTTNKYQKTENREKIRKTLSAIITLALISFSALAQDPMNHLSDSDQSKPLALETGISHSTETMNDQPSVKLETEQNEVVSNIIEYNSAKFVEAEMKLEIENWMTNAANPESDAVALEPSLQVNIVRYDAAKFAAADMAIEIENWKTNEKDIKETELFTAK